MGLGLYAIALHMFLSVVFAGCDGTTTISDSGDATALASCTTFTGDVAIATGTTDDINLGTLRRITGDFKLENSTLLTMVSGTDLETIDGDFVINNVLVLSELSFPNLTAVGNIEWNAIPNLQGLTFTTGINQVNKVDIQNSQLNSLEGLNIKMADIVYIANNPYINDITMPVVNIGSSLTLEMNNPGVNVSFPNLQTAGNITIRNVSSLALTTLDYVNSSLVIHGCKLEEFSANSLSIVKGALEITSNTQLAKVSMPNLLSAGSLIILNNTRVESIDGFGLLGTVNGTINLNGNFDGVLFPDLKKSGPLSINSTNPALNCSTFDEYLNEGIVQSYICNGKQHAAAASPSTSPSNSTTVNLSSVFSNSSLVTGAKIGIGIGVAFSTLALVSGIIILLRRRRARRAQTTTKPAAEEILKAELDGEAKPLKPEPDVYGEERYELDEQKRIWELPNKHEAVELEAPHKVNELG